MKAKVIKTGEIVDVYHESQHGQITNIYKESVLVNGRMWTEDELDFCVKTIGAPEKIYVYIPCDAIVGTASTQKGFPHQFVTEEYTQTDAIIEKAVSYIQQHWIWNTKIIEDFKKHVKGE